MVELILKYSNMNATLGTAPPPAPREGSGRARTLFRPSCVSVRESQSFVAMNF